MLGHDIKTHKQIGLKVGTLTHEKKMKNNVLMNSIFLTTLGLCGTTSLYAANLNHQGFGQALIYPYYTVNNNLDTLLSVVNSTSNVKAISVKFLESDNGQEVLDFNVYLAPFDVWTAAVVATETGAEIITADVSCVPFLASPQPFFDFAFVLDPGSDAEEREREGHFEIIEMGEVTDPLLADAATHVSGTPSNCDALTSAWLPGGQWFIDPSDGVGPATGGLYGHALIVDVTEGTAISYQADAIEAFYADGDFLHADPGDLFPSMASANPHSLIIDSGQVIESEWSSGEDAISALFMYDRIFNEYVLGSGINARTEWVLTFPTKSHYVNGNDAPRAPFTSTFNSPAGACQQYNYALYDREKQTIEPTGQICTPPPSIIPKMCWNTNVIHFYNCDSGGSDTDVSLIFGSTNVYGLKTTPFPAGWVELLFPATQPLTDVDNNHTYRGYPVTGFAVQSYTNSNAQPGLLAQYAAIFNHSYKRSITSATE